MGRGDFLALAWDDEHPDLADLGRQTAARLETELDWTLRLRLPGLSVWTRGALGLKPLPDGAGAVLGELSDWPTDRRAQSPLGAGFRRGLDPAGISAALTTAHFGRYVAVLRSQEPGTVAVYRDPSGQVPALNWSSPEGLTVVASDLSRSPPWLRPRRLALDWSRISRFIAMPAAASIDPLFADVEATGPGELLEIGPNRRRRIAIWTPANFVDRARPTPTDLIGLVDACTRAMAEPHSRLVCEVSGGLDSAVVAGALHATGLSDRVVAWVNRVGGRAEGDERAFARDVVSAFAGELTEVIKPMSPITEADLFEVSSGTWPGMDGVDAAADRDDAARFADTGATALISGHGGDGVFFQMPSALILADALRDQGWRALATPLAASVARRTHQSLWKVLAAVRKERRGKASAAMAFSSFVSRHVAADHAETLHPWVSEALGRDVAPGKRQQIRAIANAQLYNGESRRRRAGHILFPLLAQPVIEACLAVPSYVLASGPWDRPYQREVFADRVPRSIRERRLKGDLTAYWSQVIAASLPTIRPFLLDGNLASARVLDRRVMERALDPAALIWTPFTREVMWAISVEAWVRHWQTRVPDATGAPRWDG